MCNRVSISGGKNVPLLQRPTYELGPQEPSGTYTSLHLPQRYHSGYGNQNEQSGREDVQDALLKEKCEVKHMDPFWTERVVGSVALGGGYIQTMRLHT